MQIQKIKDTKLGKKFIDNCFSASEVSGRSSGVDENEVLGKHLDVFLELLELPLAVLELFLETEGAQVFFVGQGLEFFMDDFPLLLECSDQFFLFIFVHEELLAVEVCLLLNLHFPD